jgi:hypothetical protein
VEVGKVFVMVGGWDEYEGRSLCTMYCQGGVTEYSRERTKTREGATFWVLEEGNVSGLIHVHYDKNEDSAGVEDDGLLEIGIGGHSMAGWYRFLEVWDLQLREKRLSTQ